MIKDRIAREIMGWYKQHYFWYERVQQPNRMGIWDDRSVYSIGPEEHWTKWEPITEPKQAVQILNKLADKGLVIGVTLFLKTASVTIHDLNLKVYSGVGKDLMEATVNACQAYLEGEYGPEEE